MHKMQNLFSVSLAIAMGLVLSGTVARAGDVQGDYKRVTPIISTSQSIIGETLSYPTTGPAEITSAIVAMKPGEDTGWHKHGVPLFAYILEGEVTVDYGNKGKKVYKPGDGFMEAMDQYHNGHNYGSTIVRILAVYMSAIGSQNVIHKPKE